MARSDPRAWGKLASMVCRHSDTCPRPRYIRGRIGWTPGCIDALTDTTEGTKKFLTFVYALFPALFGGRVVVCVTCNDMVFLSGMARKMYNFLRFFINPEEESILFIDEDVHRIGDFADTLDLEYVGDEHG